MSGYVGPREMDLKEFIGTLPLNHLARLEYMVMSESERTIVSQTRQVIVPVQQLEDVAKAAAAFCAELQEDAEAVPQRELKDLHAALDALDAKRAEPFVRAGRVGTRVVDSYHIDPPKQHNNLGPNESCTACGRYHMPSP